VLSVPQNNKFIDFQLSSLFFAECEDLHTYSFRRFYDVRTRINKLYDEISSRLHYVYAETPHSLCSRSINGDVIKC
jgi:hypothetical protein